MDSLIKTQITKIKNQQEVLSKQLISQSKYAGMNRESRRELEGYVDSLSILMAQEKDIRKAQITGERIGEVLEKVRKLVDSLLTKTNDYNFPSFGNSMLMGGGMDGMDASGNCMNYDLTTDLVKRESWENTVKNASENILSYINSQYLGDFALLHVETGCSNVFYRPQFTYMQVVNNKYSSMGGGSSNNCCSVGMSPSIPSPATEFVFSVQNPDLGYASFHGNLMMELQDLEDETGLANILRMIENKLDDIREYQSQNDKDLGSLESVGEVNEQNKLFYTKLIEQISKIDEDEIKMKLSIGQSLITDLRHLQKECYDKSSYFSINDVVSKF